MQDDRDGEGSQSDQGKGEDQEQEQADAFAIYEQQLSQDESSEDDQWEQEHQQIRRSHLNRKDLKDQAIDSLLIELDKLKPTEVLKPLRENYDSYEDYVQRMLPIVVSEQACVARQQVKSAGKGSEGIVRGKLSQSKSWQSKCEMLRYNFHPMEAEALFSLHFKLMSGAYSAQVGYYLDEGFFSYCVINSRVQNGEKLFLVYSRQPLDTQDNIEIRLLECVTTYIRRYQATVALMESPLLSYVLRPVTHAVRAAVDPPQQEQLGLSLNQSQLNAIEQSLRLSRGLLLVQGPPGTGKTTTITALLNLLTSRYQGQLCLVTGSSNEAVNNIATKFLKGKSGRQQSLAVRFGKVDWTKRDLVSINYSYLLEKKVFEREEEPLVAGLEEMSDQSLEAVVMGMRRDALGRFSGPRLPSVYLQYKIDRVSSRIELLLTAAMDQQYGSEQVDKLRSLLFKLKHLLVSNEEVLVLALEDEAFRNEVVADILSNKTVIFATCVGCGGGIFEKVYFPSDQPSFFRRKISHLIIDESSQLLEPDSLIPFQMGLTRAILVGDQNQLAPVVTSLTCEQKGLGTSLFERLISRARLFMLRQQFRMHPHISAFVNRQFYRGRLVDAGKSQGSPLVQGYFNGKRSVWVQCKWPEQKFNNSWRNSRQAKLTSSLVQKMLRQGAQSIGVIAAYKEQIRIITNLIFVKSRLTEEQLLKVKVNTVDSFQGNQRQIIIFSCVRSNAAGQVGFLQNRKRLNVAITRARDLLVIVGNKECLSRRTPLWKKLVQHHVKNESVWSEKEISVEERDRQIGL